MALLVRHYTRIRPEKWDEHLEGQKRWMAIGKRLGIPPDRFCRCATSGDGLFTLANEREYEDLAAWQAAMAKMQGDAENRALGEELMANVEDWRIELLWTIDLE